MVFVLNGFVFVYEFLLHFFETTLGVGDNFFNSFLVERAVPHHRSAIIQVVGTINFAEALNLRIPNVGNVVGFEGGKVERIVEVIVDNEGVLVRRHSASNLILIGGCRVVVLQGAADGVVGVLGVGSEVVVGNAVHVFLLIEHFLEFFLEDIVFILQDAYFHFIVLLQVVYLIV